MNRYAPPRYTRVLLMAACALCLLVAVAPFLLVWRWPEIVTTAASVVGALIVLSTTLAGSVLLGASTARRQVDWQAHGTLPENGRWENEGIGGVPGAESTSKLSCGACGGVAGRLFCPQCGTIRDLACGWATRLSLLVVRRWPTIVGFVLTVYIPGAYSLLHESARRSADVDQRKQETARQFAITWGDFRGPLITFGAECGFEARTGQAMSARCRDLIDRTIGAYTKMSWYLPGLIGELRASACPAVPAAASDGDLRARACKRIRAEYAIGPSNRALRVFLNAVDEYVRAQATPPFPADSAAAARCLGGAASGFYVETRRLGCSIMIASLPAGTNIDHLLPFCDSYFGVGSHDDDAPLEWARWFGGDEKHCDDPRAVVESEDMTK